MNKETIVGRMGLLGLLGLMRPLRLMGLMGLLGLLGCSSEEERLPAVGSIEVRGFVAGFEEASGGSGADGTSGATGASGAYGAYGGAGTTRAWSAPDGYSLFDEADKSIGIAFTQDGVDAKMGNFFKSSGKWRTNLEEIKAETYYLYGYVPSSPGVTFTITDRDGANASYSGGAKVTLKNVSAVMTSDLCVVIGAKDGTDAETVTGLRSGDFSYSAKAIDSKDGAGNYVFLLFDHLYAALQVKMRVHADYDALRTIKLKSLRMKTLAGETPSNTKTDIVVDLKATDGSNPKESPIQSITYTPSGNTITEPLEFWSSRNGEMLTTELKSFTGYFMPQDITTLILTSVYDVYDKNGDGNLIRQDCMATNTIVLKDLFTGQATTRRGCRYTVNMTIKPTYLYMLSEPDLDDPTVTIE